MCAAMSASAQSRFIVGTTITRADNSAEIVVEFACSAEYIGSGPDTHGDRLRIQLDATTLCSGASPNVARSAEFYRPQNADAAKLLELDYSGTNADIQILTLSFSDDVQFDVFQSGVSKFLTINVFLEDGLEQNQANAPRPGGVQVKRDISPLPVYAINLSSSQRPHAASEMPLEGEFSGLTIFESEVLLAGGTWYRLGVGFFQNIQDAERALPGIQARFPNAWIDEVDELRSRDTTPAVLADKQTDSSLPDSVLATISLDRIDEWMAEARQLMASGELSTAIQIYTKVLRVPNHDRHAEAQEYLGLARERNGQNAHAKAEYQKYIALYPNDAATIRVSQRLAALLAKDRQSAAAASSAGASNARTRVARRADDWQVHTFFSQYYRRDVNQFNEDDEIVSQSAMYSDVNLDVRRRGERFDFSSRISSGYRSDFQEEGEGPGDQFHLSYAYADLADNETGLRGRIGRQTRHTGGVLGRFDGLNLSYQATDQVSIATVVGLPVNSVADSTDSGRQFYGVSASYFPSLDGLELGVFYIQQQIEGIEDRQAVGGEFRYFGENKSLWGLIDYDTSYQKIGSALLQGSWRLAPRLAIHASINRRHTPFLSTSTAMIGQPVLSFAELQELLTEEEIRQLSIDRSPVSTSYTAGISHTLTPRLRLSVDANQTQIDATPDSGGVAAMPGSTYRYFSTNLSASSVFKEGDVSMLSIRLSDAETSRVYSLMLDSRFPIGRTWRINPRLRVDRREISTDSSEEWTYTAGIRLQYRRSQKFRVELEAGRLFSERETNTIEFDRESYFFNLGYQLFF
jgi:tetratricopeptide (TPR) repeat protein